MNVPFEWSEKMEKLFNRLVVTPVLSDPRTELSEDMTLGYPFAVIRNDIIKEGLADFSVGYDDGVHGALTASEKVLLYCFVNMKSHFFTSHAAFLHHERNLKKILDEKLLIIDIGCGPGTAGLAFLERFRRRRSTMSASIARSLCPRRRSSFSRRQTRPGWRAARSIHFS